MQVSSLGNLGVTNPDDLANKAAQFDTFKNSEKGKALIAWVKSEYQRCRSARQSIQRQWYVNLAMYGGNQYLELIGKGSSAQLKVPSAPKYKVRARINRIRPIIRTEIARMTSQKPTASIIPASGEDDDIFAAQAGEQVWESLYGRKQFNRILTRNAFWTAITGNGFIKTWWDNNVVDNYTRTAPTENMPKGSNPQGDICFGVVTPFNLFVPDLLEQEIEDQPYVMHVYTRSVEWVKRFYGDKLSGTVIPEYVSKNELFESRYFEPGADNEAKPDCVLVIEMWAKPGATSYLPDGGMLTIVGNELVQIMDKGLPYSHGQYPFAKFDHVPTGKFYSDSVLVDLNSLQKEYNRTKSQIIEAKDRTARPQLLYTRGSLNPNKVTNEAGLMIEVMPGFNMPTPLPIQPLPAYVLNELDAIKSDMEDISGQHQVSRGQSPGSGVVAATAIAFLQEKDDSLMSTTYSSIEAAVEKIARQSLSLVADYWELPRIVRTVGLDGAFDSVELKGADIANGLDIRIEGGSALPQSRPARQAFLMEMFKMGAITSEQLMDLLDFGGVQKLTERIRVDTRAAQRENSKMKRLTEQELQMYGMSMMQAAEAGAEGSTDPETGMSLFSPNPATWPPLTPVNEWDNHAVHIAVHNDFRKGQQFEMLPDSVKQEFARHIAMHKMQLQFAQMGMMQSGLPSADPNDPLPPGFGGEQGGAEMGGGMPPPEQMMGG